MKLKNIMIVLVFVSVLITGTSFTRIAVGDKYCCMSPVVRWKFAIYTGECDAETGCHFHKLKGTGLLEYFGLKKINCPCEDFYKDNNNLALDNDTTAERLPYNDFKIAVKKQKSKLLHKSTDRISNFLFNALNDDVFFYWKETPWDFNGVTQKPKQGNIACGYFITNTLSDLGFKIERIKLAQSASSVMINELCVNIKRFSEFKKLENYMAAQPNNSAFIIGLDFHTGYILKDKSGSYFMHSNYINKQGVIKEKIQTSKALQQSKTYMIGSLTGNKKLVQEWVKE